MPFCRFSLKAKKPLSDQYPKSLVTIGDHLRKKRLDLGFLQREVALLLGTTKCSVMYWEKNRTTPTLVHLPGIIKFLGYCPLDQHDTPGRRLSWARECNGITQRAMAEAIRIDQGTLIRLEKGKWGGRRNYLTKALEFLEAEAEREAATGRFAARFSSHSS